VLLLGVAREEDDVAEPDDGVEVGADLRAEGVPLDEVAVLDTVLAEEEVVPPEPLLEQALSARSPQAATATTPSARERF
jgi:hypothetical protein